MTFRTRVQLAFVALAVVSIGGLALGVRVEMTRRLAGGYQRRVTAEVGAIQADLASESGRIARGLADVAQALADVAARSRPELDAQLVAENIALGAPAKSKCSSSGKLTG